MLMISGFICGWIFDQLESGVAALTRVANRVYEWARAAALKLNASKTKAMICGY